MMSDCVAQDWRMNDVRHHHDQDTQLVKLECLAIYQRETFLFLYDFFLSSQSMLVCATAAGDIVRLCVDHVLSSNDRECVLPVSMLKTDDSEDDETFAARLRWFPQSRVVHEYVSSYPVGFFERMVKMIVIVLEIRMNVLHRQVERYLRSTDRSDTVCISNECVMVMFRDAWRDYVVQVVYGTTIPNHIVLGRYLQWCSSNASGGTDLFIYCRDVLGVEIRCERLVVDYYSFGLDDVKEGTNVSRLKKRYKVELGPHVSPSYVSVFMKLYLTLIADPIEFVRLEMEYKEIQTKSVEGKQPPVRGRRRRDPDLITNTYMQESRR